MATNLYETLGVSRDATPDQIRKAYKNRALQTHPDRLPQGSTPEQVTAAQEQFRLVNNAYEVLHNPQNRMLYDQHGVWPPPEPVEQELPRRSRSQRQQPYYQQPRDPFAPFFSAAFGPPNPHDVFGSPFARSRRNDFEFTDPFRLFESTFGNMHREFEQMREQAIRDAYGAPQRRPSHSHHNHSYHSSPLDTLNPHGGVIRGFMSSRTFSGLSFNHGPIVSREYTTQTRDGATTSTLIRRDADGTEHVTRTFPDGRKQYTINGVEQPTRTGSLPSPQAPYSGSQRQGSNGHGSHSTAQFSPPPPQIYDRPYVPNPDQYNGGLDPRHRDHRQHEDHHHDGKRKWWRGHH
ncbi:hypothetical protein PLICRDRAFT_42848 [Plicaturopsis crispa FD-325 SS-3]|nr:hypothetical protein PLICRDRAFT_42848 [Plicaturopsis crispa FD-325 SS-3]